MPHSTHGRSSQFIPILLLGVGAFALALVAGLARSPAPRVRAQETCVQPSAAGCPLELDTVAQAAITEPGAVHNWLLNVQVPNEILVSLGNVGGDYQLWVYGPDNSLLGISNNPGTENELLNVPNVGPGTYWIVVDSPKGETSDLPYALFAVAVPPPEAAPAPAPSFSTYAAPGPRGFLPY